jgi:hypothetical protein
MALSGVPCGSGCREPNPLRGLGPDGLPSLTQKHAHHHPRLFVGITITITARINSSIMAKRLSATPSNTKGIFTERRSCFCGMVPPPVPDSVSNDTYGALRNALCQVRSTLCSTRRRPSKPCQDALRPDPLLQHGKQRGHRQGGAERSSPLAGLTARAPPRRISLSAPDAGDAGCSIYPLRTSPPRNREPRSCEPHGAPRRSRARSGDIAAVSPPLGRFAPCQGG